MSPSLDDETRAFRIEFESVHGLMGVTITYLQEAREQYDIAHRMTPEIRQKMLLALDLLAENLCRLEGAWRTATPEEADAYRQR